LAALASPRTPHFFLIIAAAFDGLRRQVRSSPFNSWHANGGRVNHTPSRQIPAIPAFLFLEFSMKRIVISGVLMFLAVAAQAQVTVKDAWVRATVAQQKATGAFMQLQSAQDAKLISAQSPVAGLVEVHEMSMDGGVMKMRAIPSLALPAGKAVDLKPGGYHVMLMDLKAQVKDGDTVPVTLVVEGKDGKRQSLEIKVPARKSMPAMNAGNDHSAHKH
jgi:copper(I)-binding protein